MADRHKGSCFCGAVEIEVTGAPLEMGYCHCRSCRAYTGAPLVAFALFKAEAVKVIRARSSSAGSRRRNSATGGSATGAAAIS